MSDSEKLLTTEEQDACQKIAASGEGLAGQHAAALLAIDQGATRAQASEKTGMTVGQIGYLLRVFRQKRLSMFPDAEPIEEEKEREQPPEKPAEHEAKASRPKTKKAKGKKAKKGKKDKDMSKTKKKDKKDKGPKKDKKDKAKKDKAAKKKSK